MSAFVGHLRDMERDTHITEFAEAADALERAEAREQRLRDALTAARPVVEYVSRGRRFVDVEPYPDASARRALALLAGASEAESEGGAP